MFSLGIKKKLGRFFSYLYTGSDMKYSILIIVLILSGCDKSETSHPISQIQDVGIVILETEPVNIVSELTGRVTDALSAEVRPQVGGIVQKRLFDEGDVVNAGQALYQIDPSSYQATLNEAKASLKQAQALLQGDCQKSKRYSKLVKYDGVTLQDADDAKALCIQDEANVEAKKALLESARINLSWTTITAPISGRISISSVTPGALVTASQEAALATIRGLDTMYVDLTRTSVDLLRLRKLSLITNNDTLSVALILEDGTTYNEKGRLALTEVAVDESTGSVTLRAVFSNPDHLLLPGMFVRAQIDEGIINDAILAPQQGITHDAKGDATAFVVTQDNKVELRTLKLGKTYGDKWLVLMGLRNGDKLIVEGVSKVIPGQQVNPIHVKLEGSKR